MSIVEKRFLKKVYKTEGCWNWIGAKDEGGYGRFYIDGKQFFAHRASFEIHYKRKPFDCVLHRCDNRDCVNPAHLWEGSRFDNNLDRDKKGRTARGETRFRSKLTAAQVKNIKSEYFSTKASYRSLADKYNVHFNTIGFIIRGINWKSVE